jgi:hypothetical protein
MPDVEQSTFAVRLGYARWLRHLLAGEAPGNAEIARAVKHTGQWLTRWAASAEPPTDFRVHEPIAAFLGVSERWLFRGTGEAPRPELWDAWRLAREVQGREAQPVDPAIVKPAPRARKKRRRL